MTTGNHCCSWCYKTHLLYKPLASGYRKPKNHGNRGREVIHRLPAGGHSCQVNGSGTRNPLKILPDNLKNNEGYTDYTKNYYAQTDSYRRSGLIAFDIRHQRSTEL